ncbi:hypothetical protein ACFRQM_43345 [Streptomyces sp. NPDC056831]|uniref:hypothetical protein n=1 Tax=Streptomyces sp. NPDC056831 TaxID=3345954 RepID=UPI0036CF5841
MCSVNLAALPDPDAARRVIRDAVPELGARIGAQASVHALAVHPFLDESRLEEAPYEAGTLIHSLIGSAGSDGVNEDSWHMKVSRIFSGFYWGEERPLDPGGIRAALAPALQAMDREDRRPLPWEEPGRRDHIRPWLPGENTSSVIRELHNGLLLLAGDLSTSVPKPPALPTLHPPNFARLRDDAVAESVSEALTRLVAKGVEQCEAGRTGSWPNSIPFARWDGNVRQALYPFLTTEVTQCYQDATRGFSHVDVLTYRRPAASILGPGVHETYRELAAEIHPRLYSAYFTIAVNYLAEVLKLMPDYAEASGQGKRRDPVTVYGNVGAIHSQVNNSNFSVADTVTHIGTTAQTVADRGDTDTAAAIHALVETIQRDPELTEDLRAQLLNNVADVADAAVAPDEPRRITRARAAMAAITGAAGASTLLAQTVSTWHEVLGQIF